MFRSDGVVNPGDGVRLDGVDHQARHVLDVDPGHHLVIIIIIVSNFTLIESNNMKHKSLVQ